MSILETKLDSTLLYLRKENGMRDEKEEKSTLDFVHDTYQDFFLAKYFAAEINEGRMSVKDTYSDYFGQSWGRERKKNNSVNPLLYRTIELLAGMLDENNLVKLVENITENYNLFDRYNSSGPTFPSSPNPYLEDMLLAGRCILESEISPESKYLREILDNYHAGKGFIDWIIQVKYHRKDYDDFLVKRNDQIQKEIIKRKS